MQYLINANLCLSFYGRINLLTLVWLAIIEHTVVPFLIHSYSEPAHHTSIYIGELPDSVLDCTMASVIKYVEQWLPATMEK